MNESQNNLPRIDTTYKILKLCTNTWWHKEVVLKWHTVSLHATHPQDEFRKVDKTHSSQFLPGRSLHTFSAATWGLGSYLACIMEHRQTIDFPRLNQRLHALHLPPHLLLWWSRICGFSTEVCPYIKCHNFFCSHPGEALTELGLSSSPGEPLKTEGAWKKHKRLRDAMKSVATLISEVVLLQEVGLIG
jgi:hypothetical protein